MKTIIVEQLISHDANGIPKGMLVKQVTFDDDGKLVSSQDIGLTVLSSAAIAAINAEKTELQQDLATATTQLEVTTQAKTQLESQVTSLQSQVATLQSQLTELPTLKTQLAEALALVEEYRPFDPNKIKSLSFYERITKDELFKLAVLASSDEMAKGILSLLSAYKANAWQVLLDDPQVVGAMQYLVGIGVIDAGRASEITRPATREEAYE